MGLVMSMFSDKHPRDLGPPPANPESGDHDWKPFDFVMHKCVCVLSMSWCFWGMGVA